MSKPPRWQRRLREFLDMMEAGKLPTSAEIKDELLIAVALVPDPVLRETIMGWIRVLENVLSTEAYQHIREIAATWRATQEAAAREREKC